ncbi:hypothetical protein [Helicobacter sp. T3_23-1056]
MTLSFAIISRNLFSRVFGSVLFVKRELVGLVSGARFCVLALCVGFVSKVWVRFWFL